MRAEAQSPAREERLVPTYHFTCSGWMQMYHAHSSSGILFSAPPAAPEALRYTSWVHTSTRVPTIFFVVRRFHQLMQLSIRRARDTGRVPRSQIALS